MLVFTKLALEVSVVTLHVETQLLKYQMGCSKQTGSLFVYLEIFGQSECS